MAIDLTGPVSRVQRFYVVASCALGIAAIAVADRYSGRMVPTGGFYLLPLAIAAAFVSRWSIFALAIATAFVSEYVGPYVWGPETPQRLALSIVAFTGVGLFAGELARNRRMAIALLRKSQQEARLRLDTVTEMLALLESSPVGYLTVDSQELRTIISPSLEEVGIDAVWEIEESLPPFARIGQVFFRFSSI